MITKFDVGDEVLVKCTVVKMSRERLKDGRLKTRYVIEIPGLINKGVAEEDDLFEIPKPECEEPHICGNCKYCIYDGDEFYRCRLDGTYVSFWQADACTKFELGEESNE